MAIALSRRHTLFETQGLSTWALGGSVRGLAGVEGSTIGRGASERCCAAGLPAETEERAATTVRGGPLPGEGALTWFTGPV